MEQFSKDVQILLGLKLTPRQLTTFDLFQKELLAWNEQFNLTAIRDEQGIRTKHFLDSLSCLLALREPAPTRMMDIGSGASFPGIPLKIALLTAGAGLSLSALTVLFWLARRDRQGFLNSE